MKIILVDAVNTFVIKDAGISRPIHELLDTYPNKKIILTNANDEQMQRFGLDKMPYPVFTLKHEPEKTNPEYFKTLLKHLEIEPAQAVYFEHNEDAVKSAQSVGIHTHHYDMNKKDLDALKAFLDEELGSKSMFGAYPHLKPWTKADRAKSKQD